MDNLNDLKAIWLSADTTALPSSDEIVRMGKKFRNQKLRRKVIIITIAIILTVLMLFAAFSIHPKFVTTRIGEVLIIISSAMLAGTNILSIKRFYDLKDYNNSDFIHFLERTRQNQIYYYKKTQIITMALSSVGLILYLYQLVALHPGSAFIVYGATLLYLSFLWFFVRPRVFRKQGKKLDAMIEQLKKISKQF